MALHSFEMRRFGGAGVFAGANVQNSWRPYHGKARKYVVVNHMLYAVARRAEALGYGYEARLRGREMCSINLTTTEKRENT